MKRIVVTAISIALFVNLFAQDITTGLIGDYPFAGSANDVSSSAYTSTVSNISYTSNRFNTPNSACLFNGSAYVAIGNAFDLPQKTINVWFKADVISTTYGVIYVSDNNSIQYGLTAIIVQEISGSKKIVFNHNSALANADIIPNQWYMATLVLSSTEIKYYLNGVLVFTTVNNGGNIHSITGNQSAIIGASRTTSANRLKGTVDDLKIYNRPLSQADILALYNITGGSSQNTSSVWTKNTDNTIYYNDGNVGIGTTAPAEKLQVEGNIKLQSACGYIQKVKGIYLGWGSSYGTQFNHGIFSTDGTSYSDDITVNSYGNVRINFDSNNNGTNQFSIGNNTTGLSNTLFTLLESGNVGIGTTNPAYKLTLDEADNTIGFAHRLAGASKIYTYISSGNGQLRLLNSAAALTVNLSSSGNSYFNGGNVGIGTTNPTAKLAVNGNIKAHEVQVTLEGWSDFVFEPEYNLMSLKDLEVFIKTNKHLPEIPTATEVKESGIAVGEMNAKLLQKIEELTLYVIELKKEIEAQNTIIQQLNK